MTWIFHSGRIVNNVLGMVDRDTICSAEEEIKVALLREEQLRQEF